ncbi:hypothetical protein QO004_000098 [Rhizobium mesoamericanum]|uniref:bifunctional DNA primase/polymerase n=1 Tax=Rhizobium mesoamericanum TaxID=1079800 RepID=UPI00278969BB|nr:bifunctional DNA primase/polymerase [Rhizobium mesoamericanum]MDQ0558325.1 hypothetical protein [Rhizobium mesoamericanum]
MISATAAQLENTRALDIALEYNSQNWPVFPCRHEAEDVVDHETGEIDTRGPKTPLVSKGLNAATLNTSLVGRLWTRFPDALIGVPTGEKIKAWVLDIDVPPGHDDGRIWLAEMEARYGKLPETRTATTASGGRHYYWRYTSVVKNRASIGPGADLRGDGGYVIAPGSVMADGRRYTWDNDLPIVDAPTWLMDLVTPKQAAAAPAATQSYNHQPAGNERYVEVSVEEELRTLATKSAPGRGALLNATAYRLGRFVGACLLSRSDAEAGLYAAARSNGIVAKDGERETHNKIRRGLDSGISNPKQIPERQQSDDGTQLRDTGPLLAKARRKDDLRAANDNVATKEDATTEAKPFSIFDWPSSRFVGDPPVIEELVEGTIPRAVPGMIAAMGDTGKSYAALELHRRVSFGSGPFEPPIFGGKVLSTGTSVMVTSEDDSGEVHRRLAALDKKGHRFSEGDKMLVVPLPSAGGPQAFWREDRKHGLVETDHWKRLCDQLGKINDLRLVTLDPLASFAHVQINEDPASGAFVCASLGALAAETRASVLVLHHMKKVAKPIDSLSDAREAIRGSTALVDGLRLAYALWPAEEKRGRAICKDLGVPYSPNKVVFGGVVKANGAARRIVSTYVRNEHGLLVDCTSGLGAAALPQGDLIEKLVVAIEAAAIAGQPFTKTGSTGLFDNKERLGEELSGLSRHRLESLAQQAIEGQRVVKCLAGGTTPKWLDVPTGRFAQGLGEFRKGMARG